MDNLSRVSKFLAIAGCRLSEFSWIETSIKQTWVKNINHRPQTRVRLASWLCAAGTCHDSSSENLFYMRMTAISIMNALSFLTNFIMSPLSVATRTLFLLLNKWIVHHHLSSSCGRGVINLALDFNLHLELSSVIHLFNLILFRRLYNMTILSTVLL